MKIYELTYLIRPDISEETANELSQSVNNIIREQGGETDSQSFIKKINLAYQIKKQKQAFLASLVFKLLPESLEKLDKKLKTESNILRHIILSAEKKSRKQKPIRRRKDPLLKKETAKPQKLEMKDLDQKIEEILSE